MTIKGAIWYQGEANNGQDSLYACRFRMMVEEWRRGWFAGTAGGTDPTFPVGFVQIGPLSQAVGKGAPKSVPTFQIRMGQTADFGFAPNPYFGPNIFMATVRRCFFYRHCPPPTPPALSSAAG